MVEITAPVYAHSCTVDRVIYAFRLATDRGIVIVRAAYANHACIAARLAGYTVSAYARGARVND